MKRFFRFLKSNLKRFALLSCIAAVILCFALYYFGYYDISFIRRPASWTVTWRDFLASLDDRPAADTLLPSVTDPLPDTEGTLPPDDSGTTNPDKQPEDSAPPVTDDPPEMPLTVPTVAELQKKGYMITDASYSAETMVLGKLTFNFDLPRVKTLRFMTEYRPTYVYATEQDEARNIRSVVYKPVTVDRNAISLYMGYIIYDTGKQLFVINNAGEVLTVLDSNIYHLAYTRDTEGRPLFFELSQRTVTFPAVTETRDVLDEEGNVIGTETVTVSEAREETFETYLYYYLDEEGNFLPSDYRDSTDNRGLAIDYPAHYGIADNGFGRKVRLTEQFFTSLDGTDSVFDVTAWAFTDRKNGRITGYYYSKAYPYREGRATAEYTYEFSVTRTDGTVYDYTITSLVVLNESGKIVFRPYSTYRYETWYVISWLTFPDSFGEESLGFYYYDHGLMRARRLVVDYSRWVYNNETLQILEDTNILIDRNGNEIAIPVGYTLEAYSEGIALLKTPEDLYCYYDYNGVKITDPIFSEASGFIEGLAVVKHKNGLWGVIDREGNEVIPTTHTYVSQVSSGLIATFHGGEWTVYQKMALTSTAE